MTSSGSATTSQKTGRSGTTGWKTIVEGVGTLELFPNRGRAGRVEATRELVFASLPFAAIYEVHDDTVHVLPILHGAQRWPQLEESKVIE